METLNAAALINLLGFTVGVALYALLLAMIVRHRHSTKNENLNFLLLTTSVLGLIWNFGELYLFIIQDFSIKNVSPLLTAFSYSALGFLPSVVVHSAQNEENKARWLTFAAYGLSLFASILHFQAAIFQQNAPSNFALQTLTFGSLALVVGLLIFNFRQTVEKKTIWASALLVFAVSALHLSGDREENSWLVELVAHQSSVPLALAILYQNYRFAFADLFLKRAISLMLLTLVAFGLYIFVAAPLLNYHETHDRNDVQAVGLILTLWVATALIYPKLHDFAVWLVDKIILQRADYDKLQFELAQKLEKLDSLDGVLEEICRNLQTVLTAENADWKEIYETSEESRFSFVNFTPNRAEIFIPTAETPFYEINLNNFAGGRRLLSDEIAMLEAVALLTARRIDALRVTDERFKREMREKEFAKLATEAQLSALRAQINPHFLFNSLTTIGYLIQTTPEKAFQTLMKLTQLLRGVLRSTGEFCTFGEELKLIENYLDIEKTRFEEKLSVKIDVAKELEKLRVPSLILQPLVENAIKHGISENKNGGAVEISAKLENENGEVFLKIGVFDTGAGKNARKNKDSNGVGLKNIRERLESYYGKKASLILKTEADEGTKAEIVLPVKTQTAL
ncbi:MAG TPA: histidine kinase [Pyrinomonadaceae bacterium]|nr:histidine kinase [Pyrinomonadaceae bacterium]